MVHYALDAQAALDRSEEFGRIVYERRERYGVPEAALALPREPGAA